MNCKGDEKIMTIWWFFMILIISAGIVGGVLMYFSADIDVRGVEARILYEKMTKCLISNGDINEKIFDANIDLISECKLNGELFGDGSNYYIRIRLTNQKGDIIGRDIHYGAREDEKNCEVLFSNPKLKAKGWSECYINWARAINKEGELIYVEIMTSSNQEGRTNLNI